VLTSGDDLSNNAAMWSTGLLLGEYQGVPSRSGGDPILNIGSPKGVSREPLEKPVPVHDIRATILHQLGINHERLIFTHAGRPFRLTDVHGHVMSDLV